MILANLRRSLVLGAIAIVLTFVYAFAGTGISQLFFRHQADGSITPNGSTLIGQNWSSTRWFHGRPDDTGPYAANPKATPPVPGGDNPLVANGNSGESGASNLGPRSKVLLDNTRQLVAYWHKLGVEPHPGLGDDLGQRLRPRHQPAGCDGPDPHGLSRNGYIPFRPAPAHRQGNQQRPIGFSREQLHRRTAAERGSRSPPVTSWLPPDTAEWGGRPVARTIADARPRRRITVTGTVVAMTLRSEPCLVLDARIDDGTGRLILRWLGRSSIPGISRDARLRIEGTILLSRGELVVLNPLHEVSSHPQEEW